MSISKSALRTWFVAFGLCGLSLAARGEELVILTSFPPAFYEPLTELFEQTHPDMDVEIVQRSTTSAVRFLLERQSVDVDVFWASSPDAFELLKGEEQLARLTFTPVTGEETVAGYPVNDADGTYFGFAFSTFGAAYNPSYLARHDVPVPKSWSDLTLPVYWGHIGITAPSRSGTSHFIVEAILQAYGWDDGWRMIARLGGNLSTVTARSFGIADGIEQGRFGVGLSIDFLATVERRSDAIEFAVLDPLFLVPASIAVLERSNRKDIATDFVKFLLSTDTQLMLMSPQMGRIPVVAELRRLALEDRGIGLPEPVASSGAIFDSGLSARRYELVNTLFDEWIVNRRREISSIWSRLNDLDPAIAAPLVDLIAAPPVSEVQAMQIAASMIPHTKAAASLEELPIFADEIREAVDERLAAIETELGRVADTQNQ